MVVQSASLVRAAALRSSALRLAKSAGCCKSPLGPAPQRIRPPSVRRARCRSSYGLQLDQTEGIQIQASKAQLNYSLWQLRPHTFPPDVGRQVCCGLR
jgi:hypothetical protein